MYIYTHIDIYLHTYIYKFVCFVLFCLKAQFLGLLPREAQHLAALAGVGMHRQQEEGKPCLQQAPGRSACNQAAFSCCEGRN